VRLSATAAPPAASAIATLDLRRVRIRLRRRRRVRRRRWVGRRHWVRTGRGRTWSGRRSGTWIRVDWRRRLVGRRHVAGSSGAGTSAGTSGAAGVPGSGSIGVTGASGTAGVAGSVGCGTSIDGEYLYMTHSYPLPRNRQPPVLKRTDHDRRRACRRRRGSRSPGTATRSRAPSVRRLDRRRTATAEAPRTAPTAA
jgi:hypothetical protein